MASEAVTVELGEAWGGNGSTVTRNREDGFGGAMALWMGTSCADAIETEEGGGGGGGFIGIALNGTVTCGAGGFGTMVDKGRGSGGGGHTRELGSCQAGTRL